MSPSIGQLFNKDRLNGNIVQLLMLIFYAPLGLVLVLLRCFIFLQLIIAVALLPQRSLISRLVVRALCCTLGLVVRQHNAQNKSLSSSVQQHLSCSEHLPSGRRRLVLLSNHISVFDHLILSLLVPCVKVEGNGEGIPRLVSSLLGCLVLAGGPGDRSDPAAGDSLVPTLQRFVGSENAAGPAPGSSSVRNDGPATADGDADSKVRQRTVAGPGLVNTTSSTDNASSLTQPSRDSSRHSAVPSQSLREFNDWPLLLFPEGSTTNGTVALLQYEKWAGRVSPSMALLVAISARRMPPLPLTLAVTPSSSFLQEVFSLFFCPFTVYNVTCVGEVSQQNGETEDNFCKRLQTTTAASLGLQASAYSLQDKMEYLKALAAEQRRIAASQSHQSASYHPRDDPVRGSSELRQMVTQVHEVLPDVPVAAIWRDLVRSGNVDVTITNFLEGAVPDYVPSPTSTTSSSSSSSMSGSSNQVAASISPNQPLSSTPTQGMTRPTNLSSASNITPASSSYSDTSVDRSNGCSPSFSCSSINLSTKADSFPRSACERMLSFNQRKAILLENALKKYVENFGVNGERDPYLKCS
ncbi:Ubiquitin system component Cue [Trinorchestia longiramus]|nr:Ubiquitin system component Cue [Trinorchestia longiramus]